MWVSKEKWKEMENRIKRLEDNERVYCYELNKRVTFSEYVRFVPKLIKEAIAKSNGNQS